MKKFFKKKEKTETVSENTDKKKRRFKKRYATH